MEDLNGDPKDEEKINILYEEHTENILLSDVVVCFYEKEPSGELIRNKDFAITEGKQVFITNNFENIKL